MRKTWGPFTGRQLTLVLITAIVAIFVPGTVWAVDTFSNVAIEDPVSGLKASLDNQHRLKVLDSGTVTANETTAANYVHALLFIGGCGAPSYTVPAGHALVIKSVSFFLHADTTGSPGELDLEAGTSASPCGGIIAAAPTDADESTASASLGAGVGVPAGGTLTVVGSNEIGSLMVYGYLVPSGAVPASAATTVGSTVRPGRTPTTAAR